MSTTTMAKPKTDRDAFHRFVRSTYEDLALYAIRRVGPVDAEDIVSEAYAVAWRKWVDPPPADPRPWLFGIARNLIRNEKRRRFRATQRDLPKAYPAMPARDPELAEAFATLAPADQEVLRLVAWEGLEAGQIAEVLNIRPGTAATRISRARARLAAALEDS